MWRATTRPPGHASSLPWSSVNASAVTSPPGRLSNAVNARRSKFLLARRAEDHQRPVLVVLVAVPVDDGAVGEREDLAVRVSHAVDEGDALVRPVRLRALAVHALEVQLRVAIALEARKRFAIHPPFVLLVPRDDRPARLRPHGFAFEAHERVGTLSLLRSVRVRENQSERLGHAKEGAT